MPTPMTYGGTMAALCLTEVKGGWGGKRIVTLNL